MFLLRISLVFLCRMRVLVLSLDSNHHPQIRYWGLGMFMPAGFYRPQCRGIVTPIIFLGNVPVDKFDHRFQSQTWVEFFFFSHDLFPSSLPPECPCRACPSVCRHAATRRAYVLRGESQPSRRSGWRAGYIRKRSALRGAG